jgi:hypothetical protein
MSNDVFDPDGRHHPDAFSAPVSEILLETHPTCRCGKKLVGLVYDGDTCMGCAEAKQAAFLKKEFGLKTT